MPDLLASSNRFLTAQLKQFRGVEVVYAPGGELLNGIAITATRCKVGADATIGPIEQLNVEDRRLDWLIDIDEIDGEPVPGDRIIDEETEYAVQAFPGIPSWRWSDSSRTRYRVHTREVASSN